MSGIGFDITLINLYEFYDYLSREGCKDLLKCGYIFNIENMLKWRCFQNELDLVEVRESLIHDRGVFSKCDIETGKIITFYPGDIIYCKFNINGVEKARMSVKSENFDVMIFTQNFLSRYRYDVNKEYSIVGNPNNINDNTYIGHMINDAAKIDKDDNDGSKYKIETSSKCNVKFVSINNYHIAIVSTRDIKKDEEILIRYGLGYWSMI